MAFGQLIHALKSMISYAKRNKVKSIKLQLFNENLTELFFKGSCPAGWDPYKNKCYLVNSARSVHTSWFDANTTCSNYGAQMVTIKE